MEPYSSCISTGTISHEEYIISENILPKNKFLFELQTKVDNFIGKEIFVPIWTSILRDCEVIECREEENNTFRLILDSAYQAETDSKEGTILYIEKEIVMQIIPNCCEIIFPKVKELFDSNIGINPQNKELNAIWGWQVTCVGTFTGVGYSQRWNSENCNIINDNVNDALIKSWATPRCLTVEETIREWDERGRARID